MRGTLTFSNKEIIVRNIRIIVVLLSFTLLVTSSAFADLATSPPGSGLGLGCTICPTPPAPQPQKPEEAIKAEPVRPVQPMEYSWYFVSYGNYNYGTHGPYSSKGKCETARQVVDDSDRCFAQWRYKFIE